MHVINLYIATISNSILQAFPEQYEFSTYTCCYPHTSKTQHRGASDMKRPESYTAKELMHSPCGYLQVQV